ncbi:unnamed protein product [Auanema sp. JU1783]|nr:unnamed protein product [Auanema sp. JU1783]
MTGDKILSLDHHVSPSYAKAVRDQLPPGTQIKEVMPRTPLSASEFPSVRRSMRSKLPVSVSQSEVIQTRRQVSCPQTTADCDIVTENTENIEEQDKPQSTLLGAVPSTDEATPSKETDIHVVPSVLPEMESSMHSSYYKSAFSNPQLSSNQRTASSETFIISAADSPTKYSTVTVHATTCAPSVSTANSPSLRRILGTRKHDENSIDHFGSFRSDMTGDVSSIREEKEAAQIASRLFRLDGFTKADVSARLNDSSETSTLISSKYLELFSFSGLRIDAALRDFLARVELKGETSQRERMLRFFSERYYQANPSIFNNLDEVHTLTCALLLLNSDLHGPNLGKKMIVRDFINNISNTGVDIKRDLLKTLYNSIKEKAIASQSETPALSKASKRPFSSGQMLHEVDPESQVEYKSGWIMRKSLYDSDGAKTPFGRRGWRIWFARLRGMVLYLERDEGERKQSRYEIFSNAILLHHSFAEPAFDYTKRQFIFRLRTANLGEYLFQTSSAADVRDWVNQINFVCAAFSSRTLPPPAGSQVTFVRARHPKASSQAPLAEQLKAHESAAAELRQQLAVVQEGAPPLKAKGRAVEEFFFQERYLTQEIARYDEYCVLLRNRVKFCGGSSDSTSGVHSKSDMADDLAERISYREATHN